MSVCERCWRDAAGQVVIDPSKSQTEHYHELLAIRPRPCGLADPASSRIIVERDADGLPTRLFIDPRKP